MAAETYTDQVTGSAIQTSDLGLNDQTSATTITLAAGASKIQRINMTAAGQDLRMPPATTYSLGEAWVVHNVGANAFDITDQSGGVTIIAATAGSAYYVYVRVNTTSDGTWQGSTFGGGGASPGANSDITSLSGLTTPLTLVQGGTGADLSATGGAKQYVKQSSAGAVFTVATIPAADYPDVIGDSGAGGTKGAAPAPGVGDAAANKFLKADGTWATPSGTGAGAAEGYVTIGNTAGLSAERALTAGAGISVTDAGANSTVTLAVDVPLPAVAANGSKMPRVNAGATAIEYRTAAQVLADISGAAASEAFVTVGNTAGLSAERALVASTGLSLADGGAGGNATLSLDDTAVTPAAYTNATITVDQQGRLTAAASGIAPASLWLGTFTAAAAATLDITGVFTSTYKYYKIVVTGIVAASDAQELYMRVSIDNDTTYKSGATDYGWMGGRWSDNGSDTTALNNTSDTAGSEIRLSTAGQFGTGTNEKGHAVIEVFDPAAGNVVLFKSELALRSADSANLHSVDVVSHYKGSTSAVTDIRLLMASGNITGTAKVYGFV